MKTSKKLFILTLLLFFSVFLQPAVFAAPLAQDAVTCEQEVIVQADDWLSKIA